MPAAKRVRKKATAKGEGAAKRRVKKRPKPKRQVRTSERNAYKTCRWMWDRSYNDKLKPIREKPSLAFGTMIHKALEMYYPPGLKRGPHPAEVFADLFEDEIKELGHMKDAEEEWTDAFELGVSMLEGYVEEYGEDQEWEIIQAEMTFQVPVRDPRNRKRILFWYVGTMDDVRRHVDTGRIKINDYKTTSGDPIKEAMGKGVLDEQATAYWTWGVDFLIREGIMKPRELESLDGMLYTFLRKAMKDTRPVNAAGQSLNKPKKSDLIALYKREGRDLPEGTGKGGAVLVDDMLADLGDRGLQLGEVSERQPVPRFHRESVYRSEADRESARERAALEVIEMEAVKAGDLAVYKNPSTGSMGHCNWCGYRDICELHESGDDWENVRDVTMESWEPYSAHEIESEGK